MSSRPTGSPAASITANWRDASDTAFFGRWAEVIVNKRDDGVMIVIMDQGCGFCWQNLVRNEPAPAEAAADPDGQGRAIARESVSTACASVIWAIR